jgi:putative endonuclease
VRSGFFVYLLASKSRTLYVGVTNDLARRMYEHKQGLVRGFSWKYNLDRLVYFETTSDVFAAIAREKQIKGWRRAKKVSLIESGNSAWKDLAEEVGGTQGVPRPPAAE